MRLNRRELLGGKTNTQQSHVASLVVQCLPDKQSKTCAAIEALPSAEIPLREKSGKMVVLIEVESESELLETITEIESIPGVISVNLAFHQVDA